MHKKIPKICTGCRVSAAKIYLYHSTEIAKARPHSEDWQTDSSVQKQWSMLRPTKAETFFFDEKRADSFFFYQRTIVNTPVRQKASLITILTLCYFLFFRPL